MCISLSLKLYLLKCKSVAFVSRSMKQSKVIYCKYVFEDTALKKIKTNKQTGKNISIISCVLITNNLFFFLDKNVRYITHHGVF